MAVKSSPLDLEPVSELDLPECDLAPFILIMVACLLFSAENGAKKSSSSSLSAILVSC